MGKSTTVAKGAPARERLSIPGTSVFLKELGANWGVMIQETAPATTVSDDQVDKVRKSLENYQVTGRGLHYKCLALRNHVKNTLAGPQTKKDGEK